VIAPALDGAIDNAQYEIGIGGHDLPWRWALACDEFLKFPQDCPARDA
jgi:hypothetical protein